ncbi:MAG: metallopeptidase family protein [Verrucomicrobia bacterium]|nr:MAG: metallopeptidase family protein [Verrucomicrobiota bacterium]
MKPTRLLRLRRIAEAEVSRTLRRLPPALRQEAERLPVTFEERPNDATVADGIDPDVLGLFVGPPYESEGVADVPAQIILYLANLWDFAGGDEDIFREEVRTTYLHELGHYLGLDEEDLDLRGLL